MIMLIGCFINEKRGFSSGAVELMVLTAYLLGQCNGSLDELEKLRAGKPDATGSV